MAEKILVVDDERPIAEILKYNLEKEGFEVILAFDGPEALDLVAKEQPDLIILDIMLPKKDGFTVCREIRTEQVHYSFGPKRRSIRFLGWSWGPMIM